MPGPNLGDLSTAARGFLMGAADIVPGVSGGTVALVLGIYRRLLTAISHFDGALIGLLQRGAWREAARHVDLRFLAALALGIAVAIVSLARLMHYLLEHHLGLTYAAFFGLILASGVLVGRMCQPKSRGESLACVAIGLAAAGAAFWIVTLERMAPQAGLLYTFCCGAIAICAMILPGVSGSYLLVMLGKYHEITGIIKNLPTLKATGEELVTLVAFALGCATGLLIFSRVLRWLLSHYWTLTMAALCGFMIGSLYKIWPFQIDTTPTVEEFKEKIFEPNWPAVFDVYTAACLGIAAVAFIGVLAMDAFARRDLSRAGERL